MITGVGIKAVREMRNQSRENISTEGWVLWAAFTFGGLSAFALTKHPAYLAAGVVIGLYLLFAVKVADQWEKAAVLRLGRYRGCGGPAFF